MFISDAYAQTAGSAGGAGGGLLGLLPIILMFVVLYFLMIRPQMKRQKEQKAMIDALGKGDEVVSAGGVVGRVTKVGDAYITIEIAEGTEIIMQKAAVTLLRCYCLKAQSRHCKAASCFQSGTGCRIFSFNVARHEPLPPLEISADRTGAGHGRSVYRAEFFW